MEKGQSRLASLVESLLNIAIGFGVAIAAQLVVFPMYQVHIAFTTNLQIGLWFTLVSVVRSYILRRWFNGLTVRWSERLVQATSQRVQQGETK